MKKIISIVGARPQFIKLGPLSKEIRKDYEEIIVHTGQHYDENMSQHIFKDLEIPEPDYNLEVGSGSHNVQTAEMLKKIEIVIEKEIPDLMIIFGDTNTTVAGSLTAAKMQIPSVHVEAGLRSFNKKMPEEINRIIADHVSDILFAPTNEAIKNLTNEGLLEKAVKTGDIMVDAIKSNIRKARENSSILKRLGINSDAYYLLTLHRPYNVDEPDNLKKILCNLNQIKEQIIFPCHPRTRAIVKKYNINLGQNIKLIEPVGYLDFLQLESGAQKILTDSGGIQKEAYMLKIPCITIRTETEWVETVQDGWNLLLPATSDKFAESIQTFQPQSVHSNVFGENVAKRMVSEINKMLN